MIHYVQNRVEVLSFYPINLKNLTLGNHSVHFDGGGWVGVKYSITLPYPSHRGRGTERLQLWRRVLALLN